MDAAVAEPCGLFRGCGAFCIISFFFVVTAELLDSVLLKTVLFPCGGLQRPLSGCGNVTKKNKTATTIFNFFSPFLDAGVGVVIVNTLMVLGFRFIPGDIRMGVEAQGHVA